MASKSKENGQDPTMKIFSKPFFWLIMIFTIAIGIRVWYIPQDVPIATDGFFSFVYALKTVFEGAIIGRML